MGFMDEMKKLVKPYAEDDEDDFDDFDAPEAPAPRPSPSAFDDTVYTGSNNRNKVLNINTTAQLQVVLVKPDRFDNVSEIAEHLRNKCGSTMFLKLPNTCATSVRWF